MSTDTKISYVYIIDRAESLDLDSKSRNIGLQFIVKMVLLGSTCHNFVDLNPASAYCSLCEMNKSLPRWLAGAMLGDQQQARPSLIQFLIVRSSHGRRSGSCHNYVWEDFKQALVDRGEE